MLKRGHENNEKAVKIKSGVVAAVFIIIIVFWGSIEIRQLTDKEEYEKSWTVERGIPERNHTASKGRMQAMGS